MYVFKHLEDKYRKTKHGFQVLSGTVQPVQSLFFIFQHETEQVGLLCSGDPILSLVRKLKPLSMLNHPLFGLCIDIQLYRSPWPLSEQIIKWSGLLEIAGVKAKNMSKMADRNAFGHGNGRINVSLWPGPKAQ